MSFVSKVDVREDALGIDRELTVADIARDRGWSHGYAWKWLRGIEKKCGAAVVWRRGNHGRGKRGKMVTTARALNKNITPSPEEETKKVIGALQKKLAIVEDAVKRQDQRMDGISRALIEAQRRGLDLEERLNALEKAGRRKK
jgi:molybdenum-dependent DNA-binding transcriptional regulator ModE